MCAFPLSRGAAALVAAFFFFENHHARSASEKLNLELGGGWTLELVPIESGTFQQGSPPDEPGRGADETQRSVTLTRPFFLGKYPVTRGQFARFVEETRYRTEAESGPSGGFGWDGKQLKQRKDFTWKNPGFTQTDAHPVTIVTYKDADAFLRWLSRKSGRTFALPSEAQWEYAARYGGTPTMSAWHKENSGNATHPVGEKSANAWVLNEMLGNVWEWCEDWYAPYDAADATDPIQRNPNLSDKPRRVLRGGSWLREPKFCRPAARYRNDALSRNADNGFRVMTFDLEARTISPPAALARPPVNLEATEPAAPAPVQAETHPAMRHTQSGGIGFRWLFMLPFIGIFVAIAVTVLKAIRRAIGANPGGRSLGGLPGTASLSGQPLRVRIGEDGFWIVGEGVSAGTPISCRYTVNGNSETKSVRYEPGPNGQFVFTGSRPSNVTVSTSSGGTSGSTTSRRFGNAIGMASPIDDDPPFRGQPPAY